MFEVKNDNWSPKECSGDTGYQAAKRISKEEGVIQQGISNTPLLKSMAIVACCLLCLFLLWKVCLLCIMPGVEARELANVTAIQQYRERTFDVLEYYPQNMYLYGSLQAYILSFLPSCNDLMSNRFFSLLCLLLSYIPLVMALRNMGRGLWEAKGYTIYMLLGCCYFMPFIIELPYTVGTPNFLGLLFSNLTLFICTCKFTGRDALAGLLLVGCFMTKQYYLIATIYIVNYCLFFDSFKNGVRRIAIAGAVALACCSLCFMSDQVLYAFAHHTFAADCTKRRALIKFSQYICRVLPMIVPSALVVYQIAARRVQHGRLKDDVLGFVLHAKGRICLFALLNVIIATLVLTKIGGHSGALGLLYFTQLLTPPLAFLCYVLVMVGGNRSSLWIITSMLIATSLYFPFISLHGELEAVRTQKAALSAYAFDISNNDSVRGSTFTSYYDVAHGRPIFENGQQQYMHTIQLPSNHLNIFSGRVRPYQDKGQIYLAQLIDDLRQCKWEIVYTDDCSYMPKPAMNVLRQQYTLSRTYTFNFPLYKGKLTRWVRNQSKSIPSLHSPINDGESIEVAS